MSITNRMNRSRIEKIIARSERSSRLPPPRSRASVWSPPSLVSRPAPLSGLEGHSHSAVVNLFYAKWTIDRFGFKWALVQQATWPVLRLFAQIAAGEWTEMYMRARCDHRSEDGGISWRLVGERIAGHFGLGRTARLSVSV